MQGSPLSSRRACKSPPAAQVAKASLSLPRRARLGHRSVTPCAGSQVGLQLSSTYCVLGTGSGSSSDARCQGLKPAPRQPAQLQDSQLLSQILIPTQVWGCKQDGQSSLAQLGLNCPLGQETPGTPTKMLVLAGTGPAVSWVVPEGAASDPRLRSTSASPPHPPSSLVGMMPQSHTKKPHMADGVGVPLPAPLS